MSKRNGNRRWGIWRIRGPKLEYVGAVLAPDDVAAVKTAIEELQIKDPWQQRRLVARPED